MDPGKVMNDGTVDEDTGEMFDPDGNPETEDERDQRRTMLLVHYLTRSEAVKAERDAKRDATAEEVSATLALLSKMAVAMVPRAPAAKLSPAAKALSFVQENPFVDGTTIWSDYRRDLIQALSQDDNKYLGILSGGDTFTEYTTKVTSTKVNQETWADGNFAVISVLRCAFKPRSDTLVISLGHYQLQTALGIVDDDPLELANCNVTAFTLFGILDRQYFPEDEKRLDNIEHQFDEACKWNPESEPLSAHITKLMEFVRLLELISGRATPTAKITRSNRSFMSRIRKALRTVQRDNTGGYHDKLVRLKEDMDTADETADPEFFNLEPILAKIMKIETSIRDESISDGAILEANMA